MLNLQSAKIGYFGKIPSTGDFVARNVERFVRDKFDQWLQASLTQSRKDLGDNWLHSFLTAPVWRFAIGGLSRDSLTLGIMIPSVDKIGRYFPFAILCDVPATDIGAEDLMILDRLLDDLEPLVLTSLEEDFDLDHFTYQLGLLSRQLSQRGGLSAGSISEILDTDGVARFGEDIGEKDWSELSLWWTRGSEYHQPELFEARGFPRPSLFSGMLRDPNVFADLEDLWLSIRGLALTQSDNGQIEINRKAAGLSFHALSHPGNAGGRNVSFASLDLGQGCIVLSDGRFGTAFQAMVSRLVCTFVASLVDGSEGSLRDDELARLTAFLSTKVQAQRVNILPPLSFAVAFRDAAPGGRIHIAATGEYLCLQKNGDSLVQILPTTSTKREATTIRQLHDGKCLLVSTDVQPGGMVMLCNSPFLLKQLNEELAEAVLAPKEPEALLHMALELALLRGLNKNLVVAGIRVE